MKWSLIVLVLVLLILPCTFASKTVYFFGDYHEEDGAPVKYYSSPSGKIMRKDGEVYYIITDHLGSTTIVTNSDGDKVGEMSYYPYGSTFFEDNIPTERKYTGQILDDSTGYYFYNARYYNPQIGRFISADKAGDGYTYAGNNPVMFTDPSGNRFGVPVPDFPWNKWIRNRREEYQSSAYREERAAKNPIWNLVEGVPIVSSIGHLLNAAGYALEGNNEMAGGALAGAASALPIRSEHTASSMAMSTMTGLMHPDFFIFPSANLQPSVAASGKDGYEISGSISSEPAITGIENVIEGDVAILEGATNTRVRGSVGIARGCVNCRIDQSVAVIEDSSRMLVWDDVGMLRRSNNIMVGGDIGLARESSRFFTGGSQGAIVGSSDFTVRESVGLVRDSFNFYVGGDLGVYRVR